MRRPGRWAGAAVAVALALVAGASAASAPKDYAAVAWNVLPPGESGALVLDRHSTDQIPLYDGLTSRFDQVGPRDLRRYFKSARFGLGGQRPSRVEKTGRKGLRILRDRYGVAHVYGRTRSDVMYGAGWVTAADRGVLLSLLRYPGRIAAIDVPNLDPFSLVGATRRFVPSAQTEAALDEQFRALEQLGVRGRQIAQDIDAFLLGLNAHNRSEGGAGTPYARRDLAAIVALLVARFGGGGGNEVRASEFLSALQQRLGPIAGRAAWNDLREQNDPEAPVAVRGSFPYDQPSGEGGAVVIDDGSFEPVRFGAPAPAARWVPMSNALLVSGRRSASGRPIMVAGPQVGYFYPELLMELDLHGGGIDVRGATVPGLSFVILIGRGKDYGWSLTSSGADVVDQFVETLCGGDDVHYLYQGSCREMGTFDAGALVAQDGTAERIVFRTTVHGPVVGYATTFGRRVAISSQRSTRGRELVSALPFRELMANRATSARSFFRIMHSLEASLNAFYVDSRNVAQYSGGRLPLRAGGSVSGLPTPGTGEFEWRGFLTGARHPQGIDPSPGFLANWNNKPARDFSSADDQWSYGSVHRVDLLSRALSGRQKHTPASVVAAMNKAATQDLRTVEVWPAIRDVLRTGPAPTSRAEAVAQAIDAWRTAGSSRLDRNLDGAIDHPGAAAMDAAWPRIADAVFEPMLGPLVDDLARLMPRDDAPGTQGSAYISGWYGYVDQDLRALLGRSASPFGTRFCGAGDISACRASLWAAMDDAAAELQARHGATGSTAWRADAAAERIRFAGFMPRTMRWSNRPTFQQVLSFRGHR